MASGESILSTGSNDSGLLINSQAKAMHSLCKQLLKSKIFRGFYIERRYVEIINDYRDVIALHCEENEFEKQLLYVAQQLYTFYQGTPKLWIGITRHGVNSEHKPKLALNACIWSELHELPYGEYWFNIKSVRFRDHEIILKVKMVRAVTTATTATITKNVPPVLLKASTAQLQTSVATSPTSISNTIVTEPQIGLQDFVDVVQAWGVSIKEVAYNFLANDISRENLVALLRFIGLLVLSIASGAIVGIKYLGVFTLRFMFELTRLTQVLTPVLLTIVDVFNKIIGGFYLLLAMIWRDVFHSRKAPPAPQMDFSRSLTYNQPIYKSIQYNVQQRSSLPAAQAPAVKLGPANAAEL